VPSLVLAAVIVAISGPGLVTVTAVISLLAWPQTARVLRGEVLRIKQLQRRSTPRVVAVAVAHEGAVCEWRTLWQVRLQRRVQGSSSRQRMRPRDRINPICQPSATPRPGPEELPDQHCAHTAASRSLSSRGRGLGAHGPALRSFSGWADDLARAAAGGWQPGQIEPLWLGSIRII
jgi:hypothetical protein